MTRLFVLLQASLLAATSCMATANEEPVRCTPDLVQDYDFTMDGHIGRVEFLQLIEDLAPPSCNVVGVWQAKNSFQSTLEDLSCLRSQDGNCSKGSQRLFAVQGVYDEAYDQEVCQLIDEVIRLECVSEKAQPKEETQPQAPTETSTPPSEASVLRSSTTIHAAPKATPPLRKATPVNVASATAFIAGAFRRIPALWQLVDCAFGFFGFILLFIIDRKTSRLKSINQEV